MNKFFKLGNAFIDPNELINITTTNAAWFYIENDKCYGQYNVNYNLRFCTETFSTVITSETNSVIHELVKDNYKLTKAETIIFEKHKLNFLKTDLARIINSLMVEKTNIAPLTPQFVEELTGIKQTNIENWTTL